MKIVQVLGYQQDLEVAREVSRAVHRGQGVMRYFDADDREVGSHEIEPDYVEEDFAGFFLEDYKHWFEQEERPAKAVMETPAGSVTWRLDDCGIIHWMHPEHVHEVKPCLLLKLSLRYGYDAEVTEPPLVR